MTRSASFAAAIFLLLLLGIGSTAWAYRDYFSETQKAQLANIQTVLVEVIALTDTGAGNPEGIREVVTRRMKAVSYTHLRAHETVLDLVCRLLLE
mgnify:CR=1 FL=1